MFTASFLYIFLYLYSKWSKNPTFGQIQLTESLLDETGDFGMMRSKQL